jgi:hypothetical protein
VERRASANANAHFESISRCPCGNDHLHTQPLAQVNAAVQLRSVIVDKIHGWVQLGHVGLKVVHPSPNAHRGVVDIPDCLHHVEALRILSHTVAQVVRVVRQRDYGTNDMP